MSRRYSRVTGVVTAVITVVVAAALLPVASAPATTIGPARQLTNATSGLPATGILTVVDVSGGATPRVLVRQDLPSTATSNGGLYVVESSTGRATVVCGVSGAGGVASDATISANGLYVTFTSEAVDLVPGDLNGSSDVFLCNLSSQSLTRVSVTTEGAEINEPSRGSSVTDDGRFVAFTSGGNNVTPQSGGSYVAYVRDRSKGATFAVAAPGEEGALAVVDSEAVISATGLIAYSTTLRDPVTNSLFESVRTFDVRTGARSLVSPQAPRRTSSTSVDVSADGRRVLFSSEATTLVPGDTNGDRDAFVADMSSRSVSRISVDYLGGQLERDLVGQVTGSTVVGATISPDGRWSLFQSDALWVEPISPYLSGLFIHDLDSGYTVRSLPSDGWATPGDTASYLTKQADRSDPTSRWDVYAVPLSRSTIASEPSRFVPVDPLRVTSKRNLGPAGWTRVDVLRAKFGDDPNARPGEVVAAVVNVTASGVTGRTYVSLCPAGAERSECTGTSILNAQPGRDVANLAVVRVGADGAIDLYNNTGSVILDLDLVGYFTTGSGPTFRPSMDFMPTVPKRYELFFPLGEGQFDGLQLPDAPPDAGAVAVRVTASGVTANTYVSVCPKSMPEDVCQRTSTVNSRQRDASNLTIIPLSHNSTWTGLQIYNSSGTVNVVADVLGYFVPVGEGAQFIATAPDRVQRAASIGEGQVLRVPLRDALPAEAVAVAANVTSAGSTAVSYISVCPGGMTLVTCTQTSTVNPYPREDIASSTMVGLGAADDLTYFNNLGSGLLFTDLQGYFVP